MVQAKFGNPSLRDIYHVKYYGRGGWIAAGEKIQKLRFRGKYERGERKSEENDIKKNLRMHL